MAEYHASRTTTFLPLQLVTNANGPLLGATVELKLKETDGPSGSYLDFGDSPQVFKTSGWINDTAILTENGGGFYSVTGGVNLFTSDLDPGTTILNAEYLITAPFVHAVLDIINLGVTGVSDFGESLTNLVTLESVKLMFPKLDNPQPSGKYDDRLTTIVFPFVNRRFREYLGMPIAAEVVLNERVSGSNAETSVRLANDPIISIESATRVDGNAYDIPTEIEFESRTGLVYLVSSSRRIHWPSGDGNIEFDYTAGWALIPGDVAEMAVMQSVHELRKSDLGDAQGDQLNVETRQSVLGDTVNYRQTKSGILQDAANILDNYRRLTAH